MSEPLVKCYIFYDKDHEKELDNRFKYYEINVEKFAKLWYDKDKKGAWEKSLLTMIEIKNKDNLEKYCSDINSSSVKENVDKLKRLNKDEWYNCGRRGKVYSKYLKKYCKKRRFSCRSN